MAQESNESRRNTLTDVADRVEEGMVILSPVGRKVLRRVLYVNSYGGKEVWERVKSGALPPQHLWGCLELARMGYEVALAEPLPDFYLWRNPFPHDLRLLGWVRSWLGRDGIVYCGHNVLYWLPFLRRLRAISCRIVSNLWAREPLEFAKAHSGIIALTAAGEAQARQLAPRAHVARLAWGASTEYYPPLPYRPEVFLACGITNRDHRTLSQAAQRSSRSFRIICPMAPPGITWTGNVTVIESGKGWNHEQKRVTFDQLIHQHQAVSAASLIIVKKDPSQYIACGFTELIEAMALARPVILTDTGALPTEVDVEKSGCGLLVPAEDPDALAKAIEKIALEPEMAAAMGRKGRELVDRYYNMKRFATELHDLFSRL